MRSLTQINPPRLRMLGTLAHIELKYWYGSQLAVEPAWFATSMFDEMARVGNGLPQLIKDAYAILNGYLQQFGELDKAWRVLYVEEQFALPLDALNEEGAFDSFHPTDIDALYAAGEQPTIQIDFGGERPSGDQQHVMDYKTTAGYHGKLEAWNDHTTKYRLAWQPHEYQWIAKRIRHPDGSLVFPKLGAFIIQRILSADPFTADRHEAPLNTRFQKMMPVIIIRQMLKRLRKREEITARVSAGLDPIPSPWSCDLYGRCDFAEVCGSYDPEAVIAQRFKVEER